MQQGIGASFGAMAWTPALRAQGFLDLPRVVNPLTDAELQRVEELSSALNFEKRAKFSIEPHFHYYVARLESKHDHICSGEEAAECLRILNAPKILEFFRAQSGRADLQIVECRLNKLSQYQFLGAHDHLDRYGVSIAMPLQLPNSGGEYFTIDPQAPHRERVHMLAPGDLSFTLASEVHGVRTVMSGTRLSAAWFCVAG